MLVEPEGAVLVDGGVAVAAPGRPGRPPASGAGRLSGAAGAPGGNRMVQLHPHRPVGVPDRHRVRHAAHAAVSELVGHARTDAAGRGADERASPAQVYRRPSATACPALHRLPHVLRPHRGDIRDAGAPARRRGGRSAWSPARNPEGPDAPGAAGADGGGAAGLARAGGGWEPAEPRRPLLHDGAGLHQQSARAGRASADPPGGSAHHRRALPSAALVGEIRHLFPDRTDLSQPVELTSRVSTRQVAEGSCCR